MDLINEILYLFKNFNLNNLIDIGIGLVIFILFNILSPYFAYIIVKIFKFKVKDKKIIKGNSFYKPLKIFFIILGLYIGCMALKLPENIFAIITKIFKMCIILIVSKGFLNLFDSHYKAFSKISKKLNLAGKDTTINFFSKIAKFLIYIITGFILISELGYNLGGLVAGLGIGSVVIALAAQDISKSFLASISLISDKPFDIGDYILVNNYAGTVEDITFRTTRIRDAENQLIVLPNSIVTTSSIINATKRTKRKFHLILSLEINTPLDKISSLTENIKLLLENYLHVEIETIKVFFDNISKNGINLSINFYTNITDFTEFMKFKEDINYKILNMLTQMNINLAYPSQSIYLKN